MMSFICRITFPCKKYIVAHYHFLIGSETTRSFLDKSSFGLPSKLVRNVIRKDLASHPVRIPLFFGAKRTAAPPLRSASSVLEGTNTIWHPAMPSPSQTPPKKLSLAETRNASSSIAKEKSSVLPGNSEDATTIVDLSSINALYAATSSTERLLALEQRRITPQTPLVPDAWETTLLRLSLLHSFPNIPSILRNGADAGVHVISQIHAPRNSKSIAENPNIFIPLILEEIQEHRYFGPFNEREVVQAVRGPFQTSPISLVPKPNTDPLKFRHVNNLSSPRIPRTTPSGVITSIKPFHRCRQLPVHLGYFCSCRLTHLKVTARIARSGSRCQQSVSSHPYCARSMARYDNHV